jgi:hypothetical protein
MSVWDSSKFWGELPRSGGKRMKLNKISITIPLHKEIKRKILLEIYRVLEKEIEKNILDDIFYNK